MGTVCLVQEGQLCASQQAQGNGLAQLCDPYCIEWQLGTIALVTLSSLMLAGSANRGGIAGVGQGCLQRVPWACLSLVLLTEAINDQDNIDPSPSCLQ